jgi:hypothetical protein
MYTHTNESESRLLAGAQAMPVTTPGEQMRIDRWRTGGSAGEMIRKGRSRVIRLLSERQDLIRYGDILSLRW